MSVEDLTTMATVVREAIGMVNPKHEVEMIENIKKKSQETKGLYEKKQRKMKVIIQGKKKKKRKKKKKKK